MAPLDGITVLDLTRVLSGPYCTMLLADMGARVIKIEQPGNGDDTRAWGPPFLEGESAYFLSINRNKESVTLDFKHPEGRALLERLIAKSDVLVENFRPGTLTKLGLDYATLAPRYPRLVYCSISGFGQTGPRSKEAGLRRRDAGRRRADEHHRPARRAAVPARRRDRGHRVGHVRRAGHRDGAVRARAHGPRPGSRRRDARLGGGAAHLSGRHLFRDRHVPARLGNRHPTIVPYETFAASDGDFVLAVGNDDQWRRFCAVAGAARGSSGSPPTAARDGLRRAAAVRRRSASHAAARSTGSSG